MGILPGAVHTSCLISEHSAWHRAGVCQLYKDTCQLTGTGFSFRTDIWLRQELNRILKLTKTLELILSNPSLCPVQFVLILFLSNILGLNAFLSYGRICHLVLQTSVPESPLHCPSHWVSTHLPQQEGLLIELLEKLV